jgi:DNA replication protein DnaC
MSNEKMELESHLRALKLPFAEWPQVLAEDERLAGALIDRLTHRAHILEVPGDSYRLQQNLKGREQRSSSGKKRKGGGTGQGSNSE